jgi:ATP-dependent Clp protease protease subunit
MIRYTVDPRMKPRTSLELLAKEPVVIYLAGINDTLSQQVIQKTNDIVASQQDIVPVVIDSYGGSVYSAFAILEALRSVKKPVLTYVASKAMSAGGFLSVTGTKGLRYAAPTATFLVHQVASWSIGKLEDLKVDVAESERLNKLLFAMMDDAAGKRPGYFERQMQKRGNADWFFTAEEALDMGFIDHIGTPEIEIKASLSVSIDGVDLKI